MTKQEFEGFEQATYETLSHFKESIKMIIWDNDGQMDLDDLKDMIQEMLDDEGVELNEAYKGNIFNFISDDELETGCGKRVFAIHSSGMSTSS